LIKAHGLGYLNINLSYFLLQQSAIRQSLEAEDIVRKRPFLLTYYSIRDAVIWNERMSLFISKDFQKPFTFYTAYQRSFRPFVIVLGGSKRENWMLNRPQNDSWSETTVFFFIYGSNFRYMYHVPCTSTVKGFLGASALQPATVL